MKHFPLLPGLSLYLSLTHMELTFSFSLSISLISKIYLKNTKTKSIPSKKIKHVTITSVLYFLWERIKPPKNLITTVCLLSAFSNFCFSALSLLESVSPCQFIAIPWQNIACRLLHADTIL